MPGLGTQEWGTVVTKTKGHGGAPHRGCLALVTRNPPWPLVLGVPEHEGCQEDSKPL